MGLTFSKTVHSMYKKLDAAFGKAQQKEYIEDVSNCIYELFHKDPELLEVIQTNVQVSLIRRMGREEKPVHHAAVEAVLDVISNYGWPDDLKLKSRIQLHLLRKRSTAPDPIVYKLRAELMAM